MPRPLSSGGTSVCSRSRTLPSMRYLSRDRYSPSRRSNWCRSGLLMTEGSSSRMAVTDLRHRGLERFAELARARPVAVEPLAVDEKRWRPVHPAAHAGREVRRHPLLEAAALEVRLDVGRVRTRRRGVLQQVRSLERI